MHEAADSRHCEAAVLQLLQLVLLADLRRLGRESHRVETKIAWFVAVLMHVLHGHLALGDERNRGLQGSQEGLSTGDVWVSLGHIYFKMVLEYDRNGGT